MLENIGLVTYSQKEDKLNCLTHAAGVVLSLAALTYLLVNTIPTGAGKRIASAGIYGASLMILYGASALYHGLPIGNPKKIARVIDYSMIFILIAGTATPCALVTLYEKGPAYCWFVFCVAWGSAILGIVSTAFFFEKTKVFRMVLYIGEGVVMFSSVIPIISRIDLRGLVMLIFGGLVYVAGMFFLWLGKTKPYAHTVFHLFVLAGSAVHFYAMCRYIFKM